MFDVLMYLFETYVQSELDFMVDQDALTDELTRAGFQKPEIYKALSWLEDLAAFLMHPNIPRVLLTRFAFMPPKRH
jgi:Smg protein